MRVFRVKPRMDEQLQRLLSSRFHPKSYPQILWIGSRFHPKKSVVTRARKYVLTIKVFNAPAAKASGAAARTSPPAALKSSPPRRRPGGMHARAADAASPPASRPPLKAAPRWGPRPLNPCEATGLPLWPLNAATGPPPGGLEDGRAFRHCMVRSLNDQQGGKSSRQAIF